MSYNLISQTDARAFAGNRMCKKQRRKKEKKNRRRKNVSSARAMRLGDGDEGGGGKAGRTRPTTSFLSDRATLSVRDTRVERIIIRYTSTYTRTHTHKLLTGALEFSYYSEDFFSFSSFSRNYYYYYLPRCCGDIYYYIIVVCVCVYLSFRNRRV